MTLEQQDLVFELIDSVSFEDEDNISLEELDEIIYLLESETNNINV